MHTYQKRPAVTVASTIAATLCLLTGEATLDFAVCGCNLPVVR
jgi:hypothetical protein